MSIALPQLNSTHALASLADGGSGGPPGGPDGGPGGGGPDGGGPDGGWCVGAMNLVYQRCSELNRPHRLGLERSRPLTQAAPATASYAVTPATASCA